VSGWPPGGEARDVEPVAGQLPSYVILPGTGGWTENEDGPECGCGNPTVVKIHPDGRALLLCLFHTIGEGLITELPAERPVGWPGIGA